MSDVIRLKVKRQDQPTSSPYWEEFEIPYRPQHNVISLLMALRESPVNTKGERVTPKADRTGTPDAPAGTD